VVSDHPGGAFDAVQHLLGLGHERIALVMRRSAHTAPGVHRGYLTACEVDGLDPVILLDDARRWTAERAGRAVTELRARGCTAALVFGDREAELLASTATRQGIAVPSELALVAYDDELAEQADIPLTAMSPAKHRLGAAAADVMLRRLRDGDRAPIHQTTLRPHLIIRESCGAMALERRRLTA
jgi:DNA-binding LacI/PurR family transcriptional regulator